MGGGGADVGAVAHAVVAAGAVGGAPYEAAKRARGGPNMCAVPHAVAAFAAVGWAPQGAPKRVRGVANERCRTYGRGRCGIRWNSPWGHEACGGVPTISAVTHAVAAIGAFGGTQCAAAKRVRGVPKCARSHMRPLPLLPSVGPPPMRPRARE
eukprot:5795443-Pyramimonas_sp.AAC.1